MADAISTAKFFTCHQCAKAFPSRPGGNKFCGKRCWTESERQKRLAKRKAMGLRVIGDPMQCARCGDKSTYTGGHGKYCGPCLHSRPAERAAKWRAENPDRLREVQKRSSEQKKSSPKWREWRKSYMRKKSAERQATPRGCLDHRMSQLVRNALRGAKSGRTWESLVGYEIVTLMGHLERQFLKGMGWHNIGDWHVDHIVPRAAFSYSSPEEDEFKACWALTNLRPLWAEDNLKKSDRRTHLI